MAKWDKREEREKRVTERGVSPSSNEFKTVAHNASILLLEKWTASRWGGGENKKERPGGRGATEF